MDDQLQDYVFECMDIHDSLDDSNSATWAMILMKYGKELTDIQRTYVNDKMNYIKSRERHILRKTMEYIDNETSRLPLSDKIGDNYWRILSTDNKIES